MIRSRSHLRRRKEVRNEWASQPQATNEAVSRTEIDTVCGYFTTPAPRMKYDEYLAAGCSIATGIPEGAGRRLVKDRLERCSLRRTQLHAQAMLDLRAGYLSSDWDDFH